MTDKFNNLVNNTTRLVELPNKGTSYQPGVCNIGAEEREKRRIMALLGGMFAFSWPFLGYVFAFPLLLKAIVIIPSFIGMLGILQYRDQFCAFYGLMNQYNFKQKVEILEKRSKLLDQEKSLRIIAISLGVTLVYTILVLVLF